MHLDYKCIKVKKRATPPHPFVVINRPTSRRSPTFWGGTDVLGGYRGSKVRYLFGSRAPRAFLDFFFTLHSDTRKAMDDVCSPMSGRRRETTRPYSLWSQSARVMSAGGLLGVLMSVVYYRALGPPQSWVETTVGQGGDRGSWWLGGRKAGSANVGRSMTRHSARNLGSVGGEWNHDTEAAERITRLVYSNPTVTAWFDWKALRTRSRLFVYTHASALQNLRQ